MDSAVEINLLGPTRIANLANEMGVKPHLVAVSTCYVAGNRRGNAPEILVSEGPFDIGIDWRTEVAATKRTAQRHRCAQPPARTTPDVPQGSTRRNRPQRARRAIAKKTEDLRNKWLKAQLVEAGRKRAASVGWPDAYAFTKALGEQALTDVKGDVPVSIVRPSIIESALAEPKPGWIRGFRMAEPVIISFALGLLKEFPGVPEGHRRRHPGRHRGRGDHRRGCRRTRRRSGDHPGRIGRRQPAQVPADGGQRHRLVHPATRCTTRRASRSSFPSGASPGAVACSAS